MTRLNLTPWEQDGDAKTTPNNTSYILSKKPLGDGSYSVVFECKNSTTGRHYAAKKYSKRLMYGNETMLKNEFEILKQVSLSHVNILSLIDYFETEDNLYLITDLARGGDLWNKVSAEGRLDEDTVKRILKQLVKSVEFLHCHNIVHHDIKAENIFFLSSDHKNILLGDFGLARILNSNEKMHDVSGTLSYMAPEMFDREQGYSFPIDIWAIGVVAYFMLGGYMPFDCDDDEETKDAIKNRKYLFEPEDYWTDLSSDAREFISSCLQLDPSKRPKAEQLLYHPFLKTKTSSFLRLSQKDHLKRSVTNLSALQRDQITSIFSNGNSPSLHHSNSISSRLERGRFESLNKDFTLHGAYCSSPETVSLFTSPVGSAAVSREGSGVHLYDELRRYDASPHKKGLSLNASRQSATFVL
ncbi:Calcium/calmodulin-dependent protein kinase cmkB [Candida tropicalis]